MDRSARRIRRLTTTAVALGALALGSHPAAARPEGGHGTRHVQFVASDPVLVGGDFGCDPTDPTRCGGTFRNLRTLTGDFAGTAYQVGTAVALPDGTYQGVGLVLFTGTVAGCGTGTLVIVETGRLDPTSGATWGAGEIRAGQGTGDLAQLSGSLSADSRISDITGGSIRCE